MWLNFDPEKDLWSTLPSTLLLPRSWLGGKGSRKNSVRLVYPPPYPAPVPELVREERFCQFPSILVLQAWESSNSPPFCLAL